MFQYSRCETCELIHSRSHAYRRDFGGWKRPGKLWSRVFIPVVLTIYISPFRRVTFPWTSFLVSFQPCAWNVVLCPIRPPVGRLDSTVVKHMLRCVLTGHLTFHSVSRLIFILRSLVFYRLSLATWMILLVCALLMCLLHLPVSDEIDSHLVEFSINSSKQSIFFVSYESQLH